MSGMLQVHIHLARHDHSRNIARFYEVSLDRTLFGELVVMRRWGRIGSLGRLRHEPVASEIEGLKALLATLRAKRLRGYRPVGATPRGLPTARDGKLMHTGDVAQGGPFLVVG